jgi:CBS domain-containing protein
MARTIASFEAPIGMFGRLRVEKKGPQSGKLDLKKGGLFALTRGISLLALEAGIAGGTTWDKIDRLNNMNFVAAEDLEQIRKSFTFLMKIRLEKQIVNITSGEEPSNLVDPLLLTEKEREKLRKAFMGANAMIALLRTRYQLDLVFR